MIRATMKCELNGRPYKAGDVMTGVDAVAALERGWAKAEAPARAARPSKNAKGEMTDG